MFSTMNNSQRSFPELVGRSAHEAVAYISAKGLHPQVLRANDPMTRDLRMDRVRIIVDPTRTYVIKTPTLG
ncbi:unnamed protein product [Adineta steineri]|uniref:Uncharacterized protein n=1 Tax=Adineta steineri TaxID=433720 RepID=A0A814AFJ3_9BILA|nr:unnamed protein product [Adineta steineri]CAF1517828.1 unnamed protein product [Adineta steineri]CAF1519017.1 unnamed protein product [Adineta steineri]CAF1519066.1 unnamed protein product [Adineta steineri]CAF1649629.1 unnamed protein product [Adineta steineri]